MKKNLLVLLLFVFASSAAYAQVAGNSLDKIIESSSSKLESTFNISPNPGKLRLNIVLKSQHENSKLEVFDVLGKLIYKNELTRLKTVIDVSRWHAGMYLVKVSSDDGVETKRFVKR